MCLGDSRLIPPGPDDVILTWVPNWSYALKNKISHATYSNVKGEMISANNSPKLQKQRGQLKDKAPLPMGKAWHSDNSLKNFLKLINWLIDHWFSWLHWIFAVACRLSPVAESRAYSFLRCSGLSLQWLLLLQSMGSLAQTPELWHWSSAAARHIFRTMSPALAKVKVKLSRSDVFSCSWSNGL